jgi:hypothetical protein
MLGIPLFFIGTITFTRGLANMNALQAVVGAGLMVLAALLLEISKERMNDATRRNEERFE